MTFDEIAGILRDAREAVDTARHVKGALFVWNMEHASGMLFVAEDLLTMLQAEMGASA